jgi:cell division protease FtsH
VQFFWAQHSVVQSIPYSQFLQLLNEQKVSDLTVEKDQISGKLQTPIDGHSLFTTVRVDPALAANLAQSGTSFTGVNDNTFLSGLLGWLLPFMLIMVVWHFCFVAWRKNKAWAG